MLTYFIQVIAGIGMAWLLYRLVLRQRAAARYNRYFLIGGLLLPFVLPHIPIGAQTVAIASPILLPEIDVVAPIASPADEANTNWLLFIYLGGALSMFLYHLSGFLYFLSTIHKAQKTQLSKRVYLLDKAAMPFSFLGRIILPAGLPEQEQDLIIAHEQYHVQRAHSIDVLLGSLAQSVLWFFPLMPFYLRDLRQEHEFEVDQLMLGSTPFHHYAETLLQFNLKPIHHRLFHSFSSPNLKQRIIMMTKKQKQNGWKLILFIPLMLSLVYLNACNKQDEKIEEVPASMKMGEVDSPPLFSNCNEDADRQEAQQCFNQGLMQHLMANITYPKDAFDAGAEGKVFVSITIDASGKVKNPEVLKTDILEENAAYKDVLELAALEVFANFPQLRPAQKDGKPVAIEYVVPISFKLPPKETASRDINEQDQVFGPKQENTVVPIGDGC